MVPHKRLLLKLKGYGVTDGLLKWFESFLIGRKQRVVLGDFVSDWAETSRGVPQGSVLGPLFFVLFINDLPEFVRYTCELYADDSKIMAGLRSSADGDSLQEDILAVTDWTRKWLMKLNASKCKVVHFGRSNLRRSYVINDLVENRVIDLEESECERDLGVLVASDLKWRSQIESMVSKANKALGLLLNRFTSRDSDLRRDCILLL